VTSVKPGDLVRVSTGWSTYDGQEGIVIEITCRVGLGVRANVILTDTGEEVIFGIRSLELVEEMPDA
jgi:hypothetical protein